MKKKAVVVLAEGFEDIEAVTVIDILRRADIDVTVAGIDGPTIKGSRGKISVNCDADFKDVDFIPDCLILPGGMPGAENLAGSVELKGLIRSMDSKGKIIAAICASPAIILAPMGILDSRKATCFPGMEQNFSPSTIFSQDDVVKDKHIITSKGVGTALAFSVKIVEVLISKEAAEIVAKSVLFAA